MEALGDGVVLADRKGVVSAEGAGALAPGRDADAVVLLQVLGNRTHGRGPPCLAASSGGLRPALPPALGGLMMCIGGRFSAVPSAATPARQPRCGTPQSV